MSHALPAKCHHALVIYIKDMIFKKLNNLHYYTAAILAGVLSGVGRAEADTISTKVEFTNYLKFNDLKDFLEAILSIVVVLATPIVIFFIIYSGFLYVTAQGEPEQIKTAKRSLLYSIIGGLLVLGAFAIAQIVGDTVDKFQQP